jgi:hypothetical protein
MLKLNFKTVDTDELRKRLALFSRRKSFVLLPRRKGNN